MFKLPTQKTPILCQGIMTEMGSVHTERAIAYGSHIVAGTCRDSKIKTYQNIPVFTSVREAVRKTKPQVSVVFSTSARALADTEEAIRAKIPLVICTAEHVPVHDILKMIACAQKNKVVLIGPSSPGIVRVGECLAGSIPAHLFPKGKIAIIGRSSSLIYEAVQQLAQEELGVSTCVSLGAAQLVGTTFTPVLDALMADKQTQAILVIGQITGDLEAELAETYKHYRHKKPLFVYIPGETMPEMFHQPLLGADRIVPEKVIARKKALLEKVGMQWIDDVSRLGKIVAEGLK